VRSKFTLFLLAAITLVPACFGYEPKPVDCAHLLAWMAGGASSHSIVGTIQRRGTDVSPSAINQLRAAGASKEVQQAVISPPTHSTGAACPATMLRASELVRHKQYADASELISAALETNPHDGALHFALGYARQQQGDWDAAFDE